MCGSVVTLMIVLLDCIFFYNCITAIIYVLIIIFNLLHMFSIYV